MIIPKLLWPEPVSEPTTSLVPVEPTLALPAPEDTPPAHVDIAPTPDADAERRAYEELLAFIAANKDPDSEAETLSVDEFMADA
jgi:hypothetical protein